MKKGEWAIKVTRFAIRQAKKLVETELNLDELKNEKDYRIAVFNITNRIVDLMRNES